MFIAGSIDGDCEMDNQEPHSTGSRTNSRDTIASSVGVSVCTGT